jgi:pyruvate/2-oxoglutarate dehydrogenase complex dihydrolipoamide acyltransferase (E2) component
MALGKPFLAHAAPTSDASTAAGAAKLPSRLSRDAAAFAAQHGLGPADFDADFITVDDVRRRLGLGTPQTVAQSQPSAASIQQSKPAGRARLGELKELPAHKHEERKVLSRGAGTSMLSVVGTTLGPQPFLRKDQGFFETKIIDLVAYEASRLMQTFGKLNAAYRDGSVEFYSEVNAGVAFDGGGRLVVYGIERSDKRELEDIQEEIIEGLMKYTQSKLTARELTRATFTITDLSSMEVDFVLPLLPEGQSCIIGITKTAERGYGLYVGFDHRVTEGMEAAHFLQDLRKRLVNALAPSRTSRRRRAT